MNDLFFVCGVCLIVFGLWIIYPPLAYIASGLTIMYLAVSWGTPVPKVTKK